MEKFAIEFTPAESFSPHIKKVLTTCWYEVCFLMNKKLHSILDISLVSSAKMRVLNKKYRHIDKSTDVLSLDFGQDKTGTKLGFVFLCDSVLQKQAKKLGHDRDSEMVFLATHGMLHVWGLDHEKKVDEEMMLKSHKRLLQAFPQYSPLFTTYRSRELID